VARDIALEVSSDVALQVLANALAHEGLEFTAEFPPTPPLLLPTLLSPSLPATPEAFHPPEADIFVGILSPLKQHKTPRRAAKHIPFHASLQSRASALGQSVLEATDREEAKTEALPRPMLRPSPDNDTLGSTVFYSPDQVHSLAASEPAVLWSPAHLHSATGTAPAGRPGSGQRVRGRFARALKSVPVSPREPAGPSPRRPLRREDLHLAERFGLPSPELERLGVALKEAGPGVWEDRDELSQWCQRVGVTAPAPWATRRQRQAWMESLTLRVRRSVAASEGRLQVSPRKPTKTESTQPFHQDLFDGGTGPVNDVGDEESDDSDSTGTCLSDGLPIPVEQLVQRVVCNRRPVIDRMDVLEWMAKHGRRVEVERFQRNRAMLQTWYRRLDTDGSGEIGLAELVEPLVSAGLVRSEEEVKGLIRAVDTNGSGEIDFDEFIALLSANMSDDPSGSPRRGPRHALDSLARLSSPPITPGTISPAVHSRQGRYSPPARAALEPSSVASVGPHFFKPRTPVRRDGGPSPGETLGMGSEGVVPEIEAVARVPFQAMRPASFRVTVTPHSHRRVVSPHGGLRSATPSARLRERAASRGATREGDARDITESDSAERLSQLVSQLPAAGATLAPLAPPRTSALFELQAEERFRRALLPAMAPQPMEPSKRRPSSPRESLASQPSKRRPSSPRGPAIPSKQSAPPPPSPAEPPSQESPSPHPLTKTTRASTDLLATAPDSVLLRWGIRAASNRKVRPQSVASVLHPPDTAHPAVTHLGEPSLGLGDEAGGGSPRRGMSARRLVPSEREQENIVAGRTEVEVRSARRLRRLGRAVLRRSDLGIVPTDPKQDQREGARQDYFDVVLSGVKARRKREQELLRGRRRRRKRRADSTQSEDKPERHPRVAPAASEDKTDNALSRLFNDITSGALGDRALNFETLISIKRRRRLLAATFGTSESTAEGVVLKEQAATEDGGPRKRAQASVALDLRGFTLPPGLKSVVRSVRRNLREQREHEEEKRQRREEEGGGRHRRLRPLDIVDDEEEEATLDDVDPTAVDLSLFANGDGPVMLEDDDGETVNSASKSEREGDLTSLGVAVPLCPPVPWDANLDEQGGGEPLRRRVDMTGIEGFVVRASNTVMVKEANVKPLARLIQLRHGAGILQATAPAEKPPMQEEVQGERQELSRSLSSDDIISAAIASYRAKVSRQGGS
jgi:hypothetical protein